MWSMYRYEPWVFEGIVVQMRITRQTSRLMTVVGSGGSGPGALGQNSCS